MADDPLKIVGLVNFLSFLESRQSVMMEFFYLWPRALFSVS